MEEQRNNTSLLMLCHQLHNRTVIGEYIDAHLDKENFPLPTALHLIGLFVIYTANAVVAITGNTVILFLWYRYRALRTSSNVILVNLCLAGLVMISPLPLFYINLYSRGPILGVTGAKVFGFLSTVGAMAQIWLLTLLTVERAWVVWCISQAKHHRVKKSLKKYVIGGVWVGTILIGFMPICGWNRYVYEGYLYSSSVDFLSMDISSLTYTWMLMVLGWILPNICIILSHIFVCSIYRNSMKESLKELGGRTRREFLIRRLLSEKKLWKACLLMLLSWSLSWTPYAILFLLSISGQQQLLSHHSIMAAEILCKFSVSGNPFIYGLMLPSFKKQLRKLLKKNINLRTAASRRDLSRVRSLELTRCRELERWKNHGAEVSPPTPRQLGNTALNMKIELRTQMVSNSNEIQMETDV